jgi:predicted DNA-binding transcriptional regulator AlpA
MEETREEQVAFGWGTNDTTEQPAAEARPSTSPPLRGGYARAERKRVGERRMVLPARGSTGSPRADLATRAAAKPQARLSLSANAPLPPDDELWDVQAAARFLKRSVSWVYHRAEDGTLPVKRLAGWGVRFIPSELRAWVQEGGARRGR